MPVELVDLVCDTCGTTSKLGDDRPITCFHCTDDDCNGTMWRMDRASGIEAVTSLSEREAELYILHKVEGKTLKEAAEEMGIEENTANGKKGRIKNKIQEAKATSQLSL